MKRWTRKKLIAAALVAALALAGQSTAAQLSVASARQLPVLASWARCGGTATAALNGASVTISGLASSCDNASISVHVHSASGVQTASGTASGGGATLTLPSSPGTVDAVLVRVDTWALATTWSQTFLPVVSCAAIAGSGTCEATVTALTSWGYPTLNNYLLSVQVSSTSKTPVKWQVTLNLSHSSLPFVATDLSDTQSGLVKVSATSCSTTPRTVTVKGTTGWGNYDQVSVSNTVSMQVQGTLFGSGGLINC